jgi:hypothetical protein
VRTKCGRSPDDRAGRTEEASGEHAASVYDLCCRRRVNLVTALACRMTCSRDDDPSRQIASGQLAQESLNRVLARKGCLVDVAQAREVADRKAARAGLDEPGRPQVVQDLRERLT